MIDPSVLIIVLYAVVLVVVGVVPGRMQQERESYLISERSLRSVSSGLTIAASKVGGGLLVTYSTLFFAYGPQALWLFGGFAIGYAVFYFFARRIHAQSTKYGYYTMADYFEHRYGRGVGVVVGVLSFATMVGWILTNLIAGGALLGQLSGWPTVFPTSVMALVIATYLVIRGFHAVVRTDVVQYVSLLGIAAIILVALMRMEAAPADSEAVSPFNDMPISRTLSLVLLGAMFPLGSAELWQRVYATSGAREFRNAIVFASVSFFVLGGILSYVCLRLAALAGPGVAAELGLAMGVAETVSGVPDIGPFLASLWFVAFSAAILSSADTFMYTAASSLVQDVFQRVGAISEGNVVSAVRLSVIGLAALGIVGAIVFGDVLSVTFFFVGLTLVLGAMALAAWIRPSIQPVWFVLAGCTGLAAVVIDSFARGISISTAMTGLAASCAPLAVAAVWSYVASRAANR